MPFEFAGSGPELLSLYLHPGTGQKDQAPATVPRTVSAHQKNDNRTLARRSYLWHPQRHCYLIVTGMDCHPQLSGIGWQNENSLLYGKTSASRLRTSRLRGKSPRVRGFADFCQRFFRPQNVPRFSRSYFPASKLLPKTCGPCPKPMPAWEPTVRHFNHESARRACKGFRRDTHLVLRHTLGVRARPRSFRAGGRTGGNRSDAAHRRPHDGHALRGASHTREAPVSNSGRFFYLPSPTLYRRRRRSFRRAFLLPKQGV